jgi:hypothetical protein
MSKRPWRRFAILRSARRRLTRIPPVAPRQAAERLPPLTPPDDDREFVPSSILHLRLKTA